MDSVNGADFSTRQEGPDFEGLLKIVVNDFAAGELVEEKLLG